MTDPTSVPRNPDLDFLVTYKGYFLEFTTQRGNGSVSRPSPTTAPRTAWSPAVSSAPPAYARLVNPSSPKSCGDTRKTPAGPYLYRCDLAKPKREATQAQLIAISKALLARRTCPTCQQVKDYYIPRRSGECLDCNPEVN